MNKATLTAIIGAAVLFVYQIAGALGWHMPVEQQQILDTVASVLTLLAALGIIVDPTTAGVKDSARALDYEQPNAAASEVETMPSEIVTDIDEIPDQTPEVDTVDTEAGAE